ncbi:MAG: hypothetical protein WDM88_02690 [Galbitalea sp.]
MEDDADVGDGSVDFSSTDPHRAGAGLEEAGDDEHEGAFAAPARAEDADELARVDRQINTRQGPVRTLPSSRNPSAPKQSRSSNHRDPRKEFAAQLQPSSSVNFSLITWLFAYFEQDAKPVPA